MTNKPTFRTKITRFVAWLTLAAGALVVLGFSLLVWWAGGDLGLGESADVSVVRTANVAGVASTAQALAPQLNSDPSVFYAWLGSGVLALLLLGAVLSVLTTKWLSFGTWRRVVSRVGKFWFVVSTSLSLLWSGFLFTSGLAGKMVVAAKHSYTVARTLATKTALTKSATTASKAAVTGAKSAVKTSPVAKSAATATNKTAAIAASKTATTAKAAFVTPTTQAKALAPVTRQVTHSLTSATTNLSANTLKKVAASAGEKTLLKHALGLPLSTASVGSAVYARRAAKLASLSAKAGAKGATKAATKLGGKIVTGVGKAAASVLSGPVGWAWLAYDVYDLAVFGIGAASAYYALQDGFVYWSATEPEIVPEVVPEVATDSAPTQQSSEALQSSPDTTTAGSTSGAAKAPPTTPTTLTTPNSLTTPTILTTTTTSGIDSAADAQTQAGLLAAVSNSLSDKFAAVKNWTAKNAQEVFADGISLPRQVSPAVTLAPVNPTLSRLSDVEKVAYLQMYLNGHSKQKLKVTGYIDQPTLTAVNTFLAQTPLLALPTLVPSPSELWDYFSQQDEFVAFVGADAGDVWTYRLEACVANCGGYDNSEAREPHEYRAVVDDSSTSQPVDAKQTTP